MTSAPITPHTIPHCSATRNAYVSQVPGRCGNSPCNWPRHCWIMPSHVLRLCGLIGYKTVLTPCLNYCNMSEFLHSQPLGSLAFCLSHPSKWAYHCNPQLLVYLSSQVLSLPNIILWIYFLLNYLCSRQSFLRAGLLYVLFIALWIARTVCFIDEPFSIF